MGDALIQLLLSPFGIGMASLGLVVGSFCFCATAHLVTWLVAPLYVGRGDPQAVKDKREEWERILEDMNPLERPGHAGSLVWASVVQTTRRHAERRTTRPQRRRDDESVAIAIATFVGRTSGTAVGTALRAAITSISRAVNILAFDARREWKRFPRVEGERTVESVVRDDLEARALRNFIGQEQRLPSKAELELVCELLRRTEGHAGACDCEDCSSLVD